MKKTLLTISVLLLSLTGDWQPLAAQSAPIAQLDQTLTPRTPAIVIDPRVELLSPGAEPKQLLRFQPVVGAKQTTTMNLNYTLGLAIDGSRSPEIKIPTTTMKLETVVSQVSPNGDITYQFRYTDVNVQADPQMPPTVHKNLETQLSKLIGMKGEIVADSRGQIKSGGFTVPAGLDSNSKQMLEQLSQSLKQFSFPLPEIPVGVGGAWRVTSTFALNGMNLTQAATYQLVSLQNGIATLNLQLVQQADPQTFSTVPNLPSGMNVQLRSLLSRGQGEMKMRLNQVMPLRSTLSLRSNSQMSVTEAKTNKQTLMDTDISMQFLLESR
jgi:hypothetical protein